MKFFIKNINTLALFVLLLSFLEVLKSFHIFGICKKKPLYSRYCKLVRAKIRTYDFWLGSSMVTLLGYHYYDIIGLFLFNNRSNNSFFPTHRTLVSPPLRRGCWAWTAAIALLAGPLAVLENGGWHELGETRSCPKNVNKYNN